MISPDAGVWVTFWTNTDVQREARLLQQVQRLPRAEAERHVRAQRAELTWENEMLLGHVPRRYGVYGSDSHEPQTRDELRSGGTAWEQVRHTTIAWGHTLRTAWLLMTQPGTTNIEEVPL